VGFQGLSVKMSNSVVKQDPKVSKRVPGQLLQQSSPCTIIAVQSTNGINLPEDSIDAIWKCRYLEHIHCLCSTCGGRSNYFAFAEQVEVILTGYQISNMRTGFVFVSLLTRSRTSSNSLRTAACSRRSSVKRLSCMGVCAFNISSCQ
jgi:Mor family transcriptional regulator